MIHIFKFKRIFHKFTTHQNSTGAKKNCATAESSLLKECRKQFSAERGQRRLNYLFHFYLFTSMNSALNKIFLMDCRWKFCNFSS
jgi:hypothetical protein